MQTSLSEKRGPGSMQTSLSDEGGPGSSATEVEIPSGKLSAPSIRGGSRLLFNDGRVARWEGNGMRERRQSPRNVQLFDLNC